MRKTNAGDIPAPGPSAGADAIQLSRPRQPLVAGPGPGIPAPAELPSMKDLADWVFFAPASGRIWFDKQRTLLMHASTFGAMRQEIIQAVGLEQGRAVLKRIGYAQGQRDAELVCGRWPAQHLMPHWSAGPRLHTLEGFVKVTALGWKTDAEHGFHGEYIWTDLVELISTWWPLVRRRRPYAGHWSATPRAMAVSSTASQSWLRNLNAQRQATSIAARLSGMRRAFPPGVR